MRHGELRWDDMDLGEQILCVILWIVVAGSALLAAASALWGIVYLVSWAWNAGAA